ncbi:hypothetical protein OG426_44315 [Streptomyces canus]|uniref:hypothetical protein n=1 Tax=Streptomyces canus TaxID=58343 RepID=UPI00225A397E|nr:hypothetical protein [Streptomyces canus]MCX4855666.1 hypothetical protein [Streptomyces canus]WSW38965.1 hypothetical protein OG426_44315 [Streptomyces canus]
MENRENFTPSDSMLVREMLSEFFPEARKGIRALGEEEEELIPGGEVEAYTLISEIFIDGVLGPLLDDASGLDSNMAQRCANFLESLLSVGRPSLNEMVSIRVIDYLLGYPEKWELFRSHAGRLLSLEVEGRKRYYSTPSCE